LPSEFAYAAFAAHRRGYRAPGVDNLRGAPPDQKTALGGVHLPAFSAAERDVPTLAISRFSVRATRTSRETAILRQLSPSASREEES
jgi:hypothetical protein